MIDEYLLKIKETTRAKTQLQKTSITSSLYESGLRSRWPTDKYRNRKVFIMLNTCFRQISNIRDIYDWQGIPGKVCAWVCILIVVDTSGVDGQLKLPCATSTHLLAQAVRPSFCVLREDWWSTKRLTQQFACRGCDSCDKQNHLILISQRSNWLLIVSTVNRGKKNWRFIYIQRHKIHTQRLDAWALARLFWCASLRGELVYLNEIRS